VDATIAQIRRDPGPVWMEQARTMSGTPVKQVLLLGAGFSRNWGGWLAEEVGNYLLTRPNVRSNTEVRTTLARHVNLGFEAALAELQEAYLRGRSADAKRNVDDIQAAVLQMFQTMDEAFRETPFEFQNEIRFLVRTFLVRFDAIFTLNQDYLLERHYLNDNVMLGSAGQWQGWQIPGMVRVHDPARQRLDRNPVLWRPGPKGFDIDGKFQPYIKLHGSSNWITDEGERLLIIGSNKLARIQGQDVLRASFDAFRQHLATPARLMVIGYGFRDDHVNQVLLDAARRGQLQLFIIDEVGARALDQNNRTLGGPIYVPGELQQTLSPTLIGISRRRLTETFNRDRVEHAMVMSFFET
jgi:hypothetical protein